MTEPWWLFPLILVISAVVTTAIMMFDQEIIYGIAWVLVHIIVLLPSVA